ncbi:MAG: SufE family protein [Leptolyngbyaceae cyanobacterium bins.349]|nr:SufE family protein [Leptolyngbyaceae cyanobacterium bins.349]
MTLQSAALPPSLEKIVQRFKRTTEVKQKYELLLLYAKRLSEMPEADKMAENKVPGCVSQVFVTAELVEGLVQFHADSDAQLTKGLVAVLVEGLNGLPPAEIVKLTPDFIQETGLGVSLTPSRANGFYNIFNTMQKKALTLLVANKDSEA